VVFIDCGANVGAVLEKEIRLHPEREYFAFEANPRLLQRIQAIQARYPSTRIEIHGKAVWTKEGVIDFFLSGENSFGESVTDGSTLMTGKSPRDPRSGRIDYDHPVQVESIEFGKWLRATFAKRDFIYLKMDIEGAEYAVLQSMLRDGSIEYISRAWIEFHYSEDGRISSLDKALHDSIRRSVRASTRLIDWR